MSPIFIAWLLTFSIGYDRVFSQAFVERWDAGKVELENYWVF